ncbi:MAG: hypothetical protein IPI91_20520 [Flavobacteriales bacterium]|nr:hypothetical protein [Flavobacteriales bacterium]
MTTDTTIRWDGPLPTRGYWLFEAIARGQRTEKEDFFAISMTLWIGVEVFNLLGINNTIDPAWVTDVTGRQYSIPDYLTPRHSTSRSLLGSGEDPEVIAIQYY